MWKLPCPRVFGRKSPYLTKFKGSIYSSRLLLTSPSPPINIVTCIVRKRPMEAHLQHVSKYSIFWISNVFLCLTFLVFANLLELLERSNHPNVSTHEQDREEIWIVNEEITKTSLQEEGQSEDPSVRPKRQRSSALAQMIWKVLQ